MWPTDCSPPCWPPERGVVVPEGGTPDFLAPFPVGILDRPELTELLARLGIRTLGDFAALPESHVLGRFGADGALCHRVAGGRSGELDGLRLRRPAVGGSRSSGPDGAPGRGTGGEPGFWGGVSDTDARAARALATVQDLIGADGVVTARLQGGRGPAQRARFVTWNAREGHEERDPGAPWPGQIPPPAPAVVHPDPLFAELADADGRPVTVSGRGLLTAVPYRLSVERGPWSAVVLLGRAVAVGRAVVVDVPAEERTFAGGRRGRPPTYWWRNGASGGSKPPTDDRTAPRTMAYAELHAHSNFSFLDGASHPEELAAEAVRLGLSALALTDHNGLYGVVRFAEAARALGLPTIFGAELTISGADISHPRTGVPDPDGTHLVVLARDPEGYARLSRMIAEAHLAGGEKGKPIITLDDLSDLHGGHWQVLTGCRKGALAGALTDGGPAAAARVLDHLIGRFGRDHLAVELWDHGNPVDATRNDVLALLATERGVAPVATNNVHYATPSRFPLATALAAVRARRTLGDLEGWLPSSATACLRGEAEQQRRFARWPGVVEQAAEHRSRAAPSTCAWWHPASPTFRCPTDTPNRPG